MPGMIVIEGAVSVVCVSVAEEAVVSEVPEEAESVVSSSLLPESLVSSTLALPLNNAPAVIPTKMESTRQNTTKNVGVPPDFFGF